MMEPVRQVRNRIASLPIRWRLTLISLGLLVCLMSGFGLIILLTAEQALLMNGATALHNEAELATAGVKSHPFSIASSVPLPSISGLQGSVSSGPQSLNVQFQVLINRLAGASANATVLSLNGETVIARTNAPLASPFVALPPARVRQALQTDQQLTSYLLASDSQGKRQQVVLLRLLHGHTTIGILQISTPTAAIDNFITTLRFILLFGIVGTLGIGIALTFPLISAALQPLVAMERTSRRIAEGELSMRLNVPLTNDEIGQLAFSFNRMVGQLETTLRQQKQFVADVSHELRTPLTALHGSLEMLLMGADRGDVSSSRLLVHGMHTEVKRMQRLIEDLLALTHLDEGKMVIRRKTFPVRTVLDAIYDHVQQLAQGQEIVYHIQPGVLLIEADQDRLQQVILNIVDNALKFTPSTGQIEITAAQDETGNVSIKIQDTGIGIPPEALPYIFDRFYRADPARSRHSTHVGGNGLGLAIARELIEAQGGKITISSAVGEGTTVSIHLYACMPKAENN